MIKAEIIADSLNPVGCRLTTFVLEYPRFVHAEMLTHRVFSKNSASSRSVPFEKFVKQIKENPAMPVYWGGNQKGMQAGAELNNGEKVHINLEGHISDSEDDLFGIEELGKLEAAKKVWLNARDQAILYAASLNRLGLHKQIVNRILEPWFNIRVILSGTEFENFFKLRAHPDAQPEIQALAYLMLDQYNKSTPNKLDYGQWHIPFGDKMDEDRLKSLARSKNEVDLDLFKVKIATARCARVSYINFEGKDDYEADIKLCDRLFASEPKHLSPAEHCAQAMDDNKFIGNFRGFCQYRKLIE
jgi:thymidylate synthase ThyX